MNALNMARTAYASAAAPVRTPQSTEYAAFAKITGRLRDAAALGRPGFNDLVTALNENRKLWLLLASDVADSENKLPALLKAQIIYLFEFTTQHSAKILNGTASVDALVDVNTAIMRGLRLQESQK